MKQLVLDTMRYNFLFTFIFIVSAVTAQNKQEREYRILKSQFPEKALAQIQEKLEGVKRLRFYKDIDIKKNSYEAKFKKDRIWYSIEFNEDGVLEDIELLIKPIDIPEDTFLNITSYFETNFTKYRIQKIQQQYVSSSEEAIETTIKNAFQNLLLPTINYEFVIVAKKEKGYQQYEILFDAEGTFKNLRMSLPPNYDHVLY